MFRESERSFIKSKGEIDAKRFPTNNDRVSRGTSG